MSDEITTHELLIGGARRPARSGATFEVNEPAVGRPMARVAQAGPADVDDALAAATSAFEDGPWPRLPAVERGRVLLRAAELLRERSEEFATVEARNAGKPIGDARWEVVDAAAATLEYFGGAA
ncbi:MAG TPA: aldehyde dehydrogenase family protein, partial [Acidimicrobiales bacterium]|nr:aldehyde dehydrogenase family protein [Acidimicrobiales bacterium]